MTMTPRLRKFVLTVHVTSSVGWLGAIAAYLALAIAGLTSGDAQMTRAALLSMEVIGWFVIVPISLAALLSGLVQSLGTPWGLFRHWWIVAKFLLTIVAVVVLVGHMQDVSRVSRLAKEAASPAIDLRAELIHSAGGLLVVLAAALLSVIKPWGRTPYGAAKASEPAMTPRPPAAAPTPAPFFAGGRVPWGRIIGVHAVGIALLLLLVLHFTHGGMRHH